MQAQVFDPFDDYSTKGYLRNRFKLKDMEQIKLHEHAHFEANFYDAVEFLSECKEVDYQAFLETHRILFSGLYPWAGQDRMSVCPNKAIRKGPVEFERPELVELASNYALSMGTNAERIAQSPGEVIGQLSFAHPFLDCNGRTIILVFNELCFRADFSIDWRQSDETQYLSLLTKEINEPGKGHLDQYLKDRMAPKMEPSDFKKSLDSIPKFQTPSL